MRLVFSSIILTMRMCLLFTMIPVHVGGVAPIPIVLGAVYALLMCYFDLLVGVIYGFGPASY